jgi:transcriptional regulator with XRE-family HTH domain
MNFIGKNISYLLAVNKLRKDEFGSKIGLKRGVIGSYINGEINPKVETLQKISEFFKVNLHDLVNVDFTEFGFVQTEEPVNDLDFCKDRIIFLEKVIVNLQDQLKLTYERTEKYHPGKEKGIG